MALLPYGLTRPFLFSLDPETAHERTIDMLARGAGTPCNGPGNARRRPCHAGRPQLA
ncbi:MAG: hypothetical protein R3E52_14390 [Burkholderiaceae bacterium]